MRLATTTDDDEDTLTALDTELWLELAGVKTEELATEEEEDAITELDTAIAELTELAALELGNIAILDARELVTAMLDGETLETEELELLVLAVPVLEEGTLELEARLLDAPCPWSSIAPAQPPKAARPKTSAPARRAWDRIFLTVWHFNKRRAAESTLL